MTTTFRTCLAIATAVCAAATPIAEASSDQRTITPKHDPPAAMLHALQRTIVGEYGDGPGLQPFYHQCTFITAIRWSCDWEVNGDGGPGDYRFEVDGSAEVVLQRGHWRVRHVAVQCAPDGLHDVCGD